MKISLAALALVGATVQAQELRGGLSPVAGRLLHGEPVLVTDPLYLCVNQANHVRGVAASAEDCDHFAGDDLQDNITPFLIESSESDFGDAIAELQTDVTGLEDQVDQLGVVDNDLKTAIDANTGAIDANTGAIDANTGNIVKVGQVIQDQINERKRNCECIAPGALDQVASDIDDNTDKIDANEGNILKVGQVIQDQINERVSNCECIAPGALDQVASEISFLKKQIDGLLTVTGATLNAAGKPIGDNNISNNAVDIDTVTAIARQAASEIGPIKNRIDGLLKVTGATLNPDGTPKLDSDGKPKGNILNNEKAIDINLAGINALRTEVNLNVNDIDVNKNLIDGAVAEIIALSSRVDALDGGP